MKIVLLLCLLNIIQIVESQIAYSTHTLNFLSEKLHKKLDTNIFLFPETLRQKQQKSSCYSSDGPYCSILDGNSLADRLETQNQQYLMLMNKYGHILQKRGQDILEDKKSYDEKYR